MKRTVAFGWFVAISIIAVPAVSAIFSAEVKEGEKAEGKAPFSVTTNSIGMKFVLLPAGDFVMGGPGRGRGSDKPAHRVHITKPFWMSVYEVTQRQYEAAGCINASNFLNPDLPVQNVLWERAVDFCRKLSEKEGAAYRLPTEAEWEYAYRANTRGMYGIVDLSERAWYKDNSDSKPHPVGQKKPNAWGLHDMCGNVWEWCNDRFSRTYYKRSPSEDPQGHDKGRDRVLRGGCWYSFPSATSAFYRYKLNEKFYSAVVGGDVGFRIVKQCK